MGRAASIGLGVLALLALAFVVYQAIPKDSVSKATTDEALVRFREQMKGAGTRPDRPWAEIPEFGVYRYRTRGSESIHTTAFSTAHGYNGFSTVTLTPTRCGVMERWQPLVERWSEGNLCLGRHSTHVVGVRDYHEFFEQSKEVSYRCSGGDAPYTADLRPGLSWTTTCRADQGTVTSVATVKGLEPVEVGGHPIDAVHIQAVADLEGDPDGRDVRDSWIRRSDGLLLRRTDRSKAHVDVAGGGEFEEQFELSLVSTKPRR